MFFTAFAYKWRASMLAPMDTLDQSVTEALRAWRVQDNAGISPAAGLQTCATVCSRVEGRQCFEEAARRASSGADINSLLDALAPLLSPGERAVLAASWQGGRIEAGLDAVVAQRELWAAARRSVRANLVLPLAVLLLACLVAPLPALILGSIGVFEYFFRASLPLLVAFGLSALAARLLHLRHTTLSAGLGPSGPASLLDRLLLNLPVANRIERQLNLGEFSTVLGNLLGAGVPLGRGLELTAQTLPNGYYRAAAVAGARAVRQGQALSLQLTDEHLWPREFATAVQVGEKAGALDEVLLRQATLARDNYVRAVEMLAAWLPRLIYALVAVFVIYNIFKLWLSVYSVLHSF